MELKKLSKEIVTDGNDVLAWMKFFNGRSKKEFEEMAKTNEYLDEAYSTLVDLSADEMKRREYEAREKALKDYNTQMGSAFKRGMQQAKKIFRLHAQGKGLKEIAGLCDMEVKEVEDILFGDE